MTVHVELFTNPNCPHCGQIRTALKQLVDSLQGIDLREINIIEEIDYAVELGVLSSPSIAINGRLTFTRAPTLSTIKHALNKALITK
ncbi:MAG: thioredoxin family protein [Cycloclasticus sp.]|nr:thioredoxin family protein [Cycloclasticus sp.]